MNPKNWYIEAKRFLQDTFGDDYKLFAGILAATSPQVSIQINWKFACRIYHEYKVGRKPDLAGCMRYHKPNIRRVLSGKSLSGRKVQNFYMNLIGDLNAVTIDTWMLRLFGWYKRHTRQTPTNKQYDKMARAFRSVAYNNKLYPAELQAILWVKYREHNGYKPISYILVGEDKRQYTFADLY